MKNNLPLLLLIIISFPLFAGDQPFPRTGVLPEVIDENTNVRLGIATNLSPCLSVSSGYPSFYHLSDDNRITLVVVSVIVSPCAVSPGFGYLYDVGQLEAGDYTAQIYFVNGPASIPRSIDDDLGFELGQLLSFTVSGSGAVAVPVPTLGFIGVLLLVILMGVLSLVYINKKIWCH